MQQASVALFMFFTCTCGITIVRRGAAFYDATRREMSGGSEWAAMPWDTAVDPPGRGFGALHTTGVTHAVRVRNVCVSRLVPPAPSAYTEEGSLLSTRRTLHLITFGREGKASAEEIVRRQLDDATEAQFDIQRSSHYSDLDTFAKSRTAMQTPVFVRGTSYFQPRSLQTMNAFYASNKKSGHADVCFIEPKGGVWDSGDEGTLATTHNHSDFQLSHLRENPGHFFFEDMFPLLEVLTQKEAFGAPDEFDNFVVPTLTGKRIGAHGACRMLQDGKTQRILVDNLPYAATIDERFPVVYNDDVSGLEVRAQMTWGKSCLTVAISAGMFGEHKINTIPLSPGTTVCFEDVFFNLKGKNRLMTQVPAVRRKALDSFVDATLIHLGLDGRRPIEERRCVNNVMVYGRQDATRRRWINFTEAVNALQSAFPTLHFDAKETLGGSFRANVEAFASSDIVISPCGAHLTNIMFMPRGGFNIMLFPDGQGKREAWYVNKGMAEGRGLESVYVDVEAETRHPQSRRLLAREGYAFDDDLSVDPNVLVSTLRQILASAPPCA